jgi:hypothetical protein
MSNTSKGKAIKGSKFWIQAIVNSKLQEELNTLIGNDLNWLSPKEDDDYAEYELRQPKIYKELKLTEAKKEELFSFWPNRQPQWDGIALSKDEKTLYLVEAKAHVYELNSKLSASSEFSRKLIERSMREVFDTYNNGDNFGYWKDKYYQLGNRLTFLHKMNDVSKLTGKKVKLVLLNFVEDYTHRPTSEEKWQNHYKEVFKKMTGNENTPKDVLVINFHVQRKDMA